MANPYRPRKKRIPGSNWIESADGWHKSDSSHQRGNADYFSRPIPPVTDSAGRPTRNGQTDWKAVIDKANSNG
jgi:hypothetical protein